MAISALGGLRSHPRLETGLRTRFSGPKQEGTQGGWHLDHSADGASRPASAEATSVITLSPRLARPGASPRSRCRSTSCGRPRCKASVAGRIRPALLTRRWSSKATWMRSGWLRGSIFWVLFVSGWFCLSKTIIPDAQEHFLTPSARRHTHLFGGLGLKSAIDWRQPSENTMPTFLPSNPAWRYRQRRHIGE